MPRMLDADNLTHILEEWEEKACDGTENDGSDGTTRVLHPVPTTTREMIDLIADQPTIEVQQWIPVTERLPEAFVSVLVQMPDERPCPTVREGFITKDGIWHSALYDREPDEVTHWMPMPMPPEDGGAENE